MQVTGKGLYITTHTWTMVWNC